MGLALAPKRDGKVMNPEDFEALPEEERKRIESDLQAAQTELEGIMRQVPQWEREHRDACARSTATSPVSPSPT